MNFEEEQTRKDFWIHKVDPETTNLDERSMLQYKGYESESLNIDERSRNGSRDGGEKCVVVLGAILETTISE
jgi:hypothetical protein